MKIYISTQLSEFMFLRFRIMKERKINPVICEYVTNRILKLHL